MEAKGKTREYTGFKRTKNTDHRKTMKKEGARIKEIIADKFSKYGRRKIIAEFMAFVMGRIVFQGMNPIGLGYYFGLLSQGTRRGLVSVMLLLGMMTRLDAVSVIKYALVLLTFSVIEHLFWRENHFMSDSQRAVIGGSITAALAMTKAFLYPKVGKYLLLGALEGVIVSISFFLLKKGISFFLYHGKKDDMNNEEIISTALLVGLLVSGFPNIELLNISIPQATALFAVLFTGYKYGAGAGAVVGSITGFVISYAGSEVSYIGILCFLGIGSGLFQEIGKLGAAMAYGIAAVSIGYLYEDTLIGMRGIESLFAAIVLFLCLPLRIIEPVHIGKRENMDYVQQDLQLMTKKRFHEFSDSLQKLSQSFVTYNEKRNILGYDDMNQIFEEISGKFCKDCSHCGFCWRENYEESYSNARSIFIKAKQKGRLEENDLPMEFRGQCIYADDFLAETNKRLEIAMLNMRWYNKLMESRQAVAGQLEEMADIVKDFAAEVGEMKQVKAALEEQIKVKLKNHHVDVKKLVIMENKRRKMEIHMLARARKNRCITARDVAGYLSQVTGKQLRPSEQMKRVLPNVYEELLFREDTHYRVCTGMSRQKREGEKVSGDSFSFLELEDGAFAMILCDGMGSGEMASMESESVIELIEDFISAGFREAAAVRLINSLYVLKTDGQVFSTIDLGVLDLYDGSCRFVKMGAAATFLKQSDHVDMILSSSLPAGMLEETKIERTHRRLHEGDYIIMMTDGVIDCFPGMNKEKNIGNYINALNITNPREMAKQIMEKALSYTDGNVTDDMTVIVAAIWEKS